MACDDERRELSVGLAWSAVKDSLIILHRRVLNLFCANVLEFCSTKVESFVLIELSRRADFGFSVAERRREFSSVVSRKFYNAFVLVRDCGLCLFAEESLQQINQNLAEANCIKVSGS